MTVVVLMLKTLYIINPIDHTIKELAIAVLEKQITIILAIRLGISLIRQHIILSLQTETLVSHSVNMVIGKLPILTIAASCLMSLLIVRKKKNHDHQVKKSTDSI